MSTVRRLYFYGLAWISAGVVIWGMVNLLRTLVLRGSAGGTDALATGLSLVLVGLPIFLLHWRAAQRDAARDIEERASRVRAVFLYAALAGTLAPVMYALVAILNRELGRLSGLAANDIWFGGVGTAADNLIALAINGAAFAFFAWILRTDWRADTPEHFLGEARRLYHYGWMLSGLSITASAVFNIVRFFLSPDEAGGGLAAGISLLLVGAPLLVYFWRIVQAVMIDPVERSSMLRMVVLYLISLAGVYGVLTASGGLLASLVEWVSGEQQTLTDFIFNVRTQISLIIPLAPMWWYFGRVLNRDLAVLPDLPRREALRRFYYYILALLGLAVMFFGLVSLVDFFSRLLFESGVDFAMLRADFSGSLSAVLVGSPLWLVTWRLMQREAARKDDTGDHARRSVLRKAYLYLVLFLLVIGVMAFAGQMIYNLLDALLGGSRPSLAQEVSFLLVAILVDVVLLVYHWRVLRQDGRAAQQAVGNLHAAFPTLILAEDSPYLQAFTDALLGALPRVAPRLPVAVHLVGRGAPDESMLAAKAVMLSARLALEPPESLRLWLDEYRGQRVILPVSDPGWHWLGQAEKKPQELARQAVQSLRQMAEGEAVRQAGPSSPWAVAGYVLGGLLALQLLIALFSIMIESLFR